MIINDLILDEKKETDGVWKKYPDTDGEFLIASANNIEFRKKLQRLKNKAGNKLEKRELVDGPKLAHNATVGTVLKSWRNVKMIENGKEVEFPYSDENAIWLLERSPEFRGWVTEVATELENFKDEYKETLKKTSKSS